MREDIDKGQARLEIRRYALSAGLDWPAQKPDWTGLQTVGLVEAVRDVEDKVKRGAALLFVFADWP